MTVVRIIPVGDHARLVEVADARAAVSLALWARERGIPATEIVPGAATVLFDGLDGGIDLPAALDAWSQEEPVPAGRQVVVPVVYDGPDLAAVAALWAVAVDEVVRRHTSVEFTSAFCGFAPGFAYLAGLPSEWAVPRLDQPRARVEPGSVGLAGAWCGVYPTASPGGWQLLGRTEAPLWDLARDEPALLSPGTGVRFEARP
ncbi:MAG: Allophanate hydrolase subunit 1 [Nocardioides sp.]|uniref:5-oxoprolinase subunit B family protein n=1 Tax=Nocardioides sp. TaxID=35761 RepID=UPI002610CF23|nr:allophanate hydrolase subunit 1 [Nocardioides sp.]MCW2834278.1 Allophanate hydrolase subunit 1 [Nocardioides sp.]